ncbi:MAG: hypothetical protein J6T10_19730 [Methanobrevibacter sp.]|nr:hypothetical protein [Methanobrevibacter sp.]
MSTKLLTEMKKRLVEVDKELEWLELYGRSHYNEEWVDSHIQYYEGRREEICFVINSLE